MMHIRTLRTDSSNKDFHRLIVLLDQELEKRYGKSQTFFDQFNNVDPIRHVIVLYHNDQPLACGSFKHFNADVAEVKRMFVLPEYRGKKFGQMVLQELEVWAQQEKFSAMVLETGRNQPEAIKLYSNCGFKIITNYGQYVGVELSVCMKKELRNHNQIPNTQQTR